MENVLQRQSKIKVRDAILTETEDRGATAKAVVKLPKIEINVSLAITRIGNNLRKPLEQQFTGEQI